MTKKRSGKGKHIPQRTCVGCRQVLPKQDMTRVVATADGVQVDLTGKKNGRGAYLHNLKACWQKGIKGALSGALRRPLSDEELERLKEFMQTLPE